MADGRSLRPGSANGDSPYCDGADGELWGRALRRASTVVRRGPRSLTDGLREHADVVLPAQAYAEKEARSSTPTVASSGAARRRPARLDTPAVADDRRSRHRNRARPGCAERPDGLPAAVRRGAGLDAGTHAAGDEARVRLQERLAAEAYPTRSSSRPRVPPRHGRLLRRMVDPDPQGDRDFFAVGLSSCRLCRSLSASCSEGFSRATAQTASARTAHGSRSRTFSSCSPRSSSG